MQAIEDFESCRQRNMSDYEMYVLISKLNCEGINSHTLRYNTHEKQFEVWGGYHNHVKFCLNEQMLVHKRRYDSVLRRRNTPATLNIPEEIQEEEEDISLLNSTVKALSYKVVKKVMKKCGLKVKASDVMGVTMSILKEIGEFNYLSDESSQSSGRDSRTDSEMSITSSTATNSTTMVQGDENVYRSLFCKLYLFVILRICHPKDMSS